MPDPVSAITPLILDRPTCLDCLAEKSGLTGAEVEAALALIGEALKVYQEPDRCRACGETKDVFSVKRRTA